ncbi:unnamed protein product [Arctogadus glacialis]
MEVIAKRGRRRVRDGDVNVVHPRARVAGFVFRDIDDAADVKPLEDRGVRCRPDVAEEFFFFLYRCVGQMPRQAICWGLICRLGGGMMPRGSLLLPGCQGTQMVDGGCIQRAIKPVAAGVRPHCLFMECAAVSRRAQHHPAQQQRLTEWGWRVSAVDDADDTNHRGTVDGPDSRRAVCSCWSCRCIARYPEMTGNPYRPAAATTTKHKETQKKDGYESRPAPLVKDTTYTVPSTASSGMNSPPITGGPCL